MRRDWTAIAIGVAFLVLAGVLLVLWLPEALPPCRPVTGNVATDGDHGAACGSGLDWDAQSIAGVVVAALCAALALTSVALGLRRSPR